MDEQRRSVAVESALGAKLRGHQGAHVDFNREEVPESAPELAAGQPPDGPVSWGKFGRLGLGFDENEEARELRCLFLIEFAAGLAEGPHGGLLERRHGARHDRGPGTAPIERSWPLVGSSVEAGEGWGRGHRDGSKLPLAS